MCSVGSYDSADKTEGRRDFESSSIDSSGLVYVERYTFIARAIRVTLAGALNPKPS
jgi:hypothetical protein